MTHTLKCDVCYLLIEVSEPTSMPAAWVRIYAVAGDKEELGSADICHTCWRSGWNGAREMMAAIRRPAGESEKG